MSSTLNGTSFCFSCYNIAISIDRLDNHGHFSSQISTDVVIYVQADVHVFCAWSFKYPVKVNSSLGSSYSVSLPVTCMHGLHDVT